MQSEESPPQPRYSPESQWLEVNGLERWSIYDRLRSLGIDCQCHIGQPLWVNVSSAQDLVQYWSVARHSIGFRSQLIHWLENCWAVQVAS
jgi:hypothetical protein